MAFSHEAHKALLTDFLAAVREKREPAVSGREAVKVQVLIEAILQSSAAGRAVSIEPN
jgi:UDP-N-acetyl-2-amino-2-deoxyglucuronate dehydrogenase